MPGRKNKGAKASLMREMGAEGAFAPKLPPRSVRKARVTPTRELVAAMIERFAAGETMLAICASDDRFPTDRAFRSFVGSDPDLFGEWEAAKVSHAAMMMDAALTIADNDVKAPNGLVDHGQVARDKLRVEVRQLRAASLHPAQWGKRTETMITGDATKPVVVEQKLTPSRLAALLADAERELGLPVLDGVSPRERLRNLELTEQPLPPPIYQLTHVRDAGEDEQ